MKTETFLLPCLKKCTIRETTGADDDVISASGDPSVQLAKYLAGLTLELDGSKNVTTKDIQNLGIRSKYFILIKSRILSLGSTLYFTQDWGKDFKPEEYAINLEDFVWDYESETPIPGPGEENYSDQRIMPYDGNLEGVLPSGPMFQMDFLNGHGEAMMLKVPANSRTINLQLKARNLQILSNNTWMKVENFGVLSSRDMVVVRKAMEDLDPPVEGLIELTHPQTREAVKISLMEIRDFFFPVKVS